MMLTRTARRHRLHGCRLAAGKPAPGDSLTASGPAGANGDAAHRGAGGDPLYLRAMLSEEPGLDPRSLAAAVSDHLRVLPAQTRGMLEMLSVLNLRLPLAQLGQAAQVESPSAAVEPAVASGLADWRPEEPSRPVQIRHLLVRDAIYAGLPAATRRVLHARAASMVSESASWEHRVAALDRPDEGLAG